MRACAGLVLAVPLLLGPVAAADARVVLVGMDGASWNVIDPMLAAGELPHFRALMADGVHADLDTVEPVTSPVVWTSIATGRSPEHHGVTDFFSNATRIEVPTMFERLAAQGRRVGLYDYLMTWPPAPLPQGFVIPGWLRRDDTTSPRDVWSRAEISPWVNRYAPLRSGEDYRRNALEETREKPPRWLALMERFDLEVGAVSFYGPDAMSHRFWHAAFPEDLPELAERSTKAEREALPRVMRELDAALGTIRAKLGPEDTLLLVSDHGFRAHDSPRDVWVAHFRELLARKGIDPEREGFAVLTEFGQVVVRIEPREFEEAEATVDRLLALLSGFETREGEPLFWVLDVLDIAPRPAGAERGLLQRARQWVLTRVLEWGYGVQLDPTAHAAILAVPSGDTLAPLWPDEKVRLAGRDAPASEAFSRQVFSGNHDATAVFLAAGGPIAKVAERDRISVLDVAPLVFHLAGSAVPDDLEGRVPVRWLTPGALAEHPVRSAPAEEFPTVEHDDGGLREDPRLLEKLRRLGYIE